jgi:hypothetical protein
MKQSGVNDRTNKYRDILIYDHALQVVRYGIVIHVVLSSEFGYGRAQQGKRDVTIIVSTK